MPEMSREEKTQLVLRHTSTFELLGQLFGTYKPQLLHIENTSLQTAVVC